MRSRPSARSQPRFIRLGSHRSVGVPKRFNYIGLRVIILNHSKGQGVPNIVGSRTRARTHPRLGRTESPKSFIISNPQVLKYMD